MLDAQRYHKITYACHTHVHACRNVRHAFEVCIKGMYKMHIYDECQEVCI